MGHFFFYEIALKALICCSAIANKDPGSHKRIILLFSYFQDFVERGEENSLIIERILILIRNILYVPPDPTTEKRTDNDASVHDQVHLPKQYLILVYYIISFL